MFNIALFAVIACLSLLAYYRGTSILFCLISSFYPAIVIYKAFPYTENFIFFKKTSSEVFLSHAALFVLIFIGIYFIMRRITHADAIMGGVSGVLDAVLLAVSITALTLVLSLHILPSRDIYNLSGTIEKFFRSDMGYFLSLLLPLGVMFHISKRTF
ncbi:MAG: hypothetical protein RL094_513 [Candidatus Parcubacteria bacterium]|jgi:hypothetical protein